MRMHDSKRFSLILPLPDPILHRNNMVGITTLTTILIGGSLASAAALSPFLAKRADGYNNPADNGGNSLGLCE